MTGLFEWHYSDPDGEEYDGVEYDEDVFPETEVNDGRRPTNQDIGQIVLRAQERLDNALRELDEENAKASRNLYERYGWQQYVRYDIAGSLISRSKKLMFQSKDTRNNKVFFVAKSPMFATLIYTKVENKHENICHRSIY